MCFTGRKKNHNEETPNHILWFGALINRYKTDKIAFFNFKNIHLVTINGFQSKHSLFVYLLRILFAKPEMNRPDVFAEAPVSHSTDCQPW